MRDLIIKLTLSDEEAERFESRMAMVVAVSEEERAVLYADINSVDDFLKQVPLAVSIMRERLGEGRATDPETEAMLVALIGWAKTTDEFHDRTRECLGRAIFVSAEQHKGRLQ